MDLQLTGKSALVTGSTAGIGFATANLLAAEGASVIITGRSKIRIDKAIAEIKKLNSKAIVSGIIVDFAKAVDVDNLIKQVPKVDILINNIGIFEPMDFVQISDKEWMKFFEVNVLSGVRLCRHYFPIMMNKNWGRIIFISSESAVQIPQEMIHYGMTKTAQIAVARGLAELTKGTNVTVNSVLPGPTRSEGVEEFLTSLSKQENKTKAAVEADFFKNARPTSLIQRFANTNEVAAMIAFLSSPLSSATNGAAVRVDGGVIKSIL